jgi:DNA-binding MarR family transcriptional regulator
MREPSRSPEPEPAADSIARVIASWHANRPDLDVEPIAITARLARLRQQLGARLERVFTAHDLTGADFAVLATITRLGGNPLTQTQLMTELNLTAGTVSVRVNRLVRDGYVTRGPDPADGRGWLIGLTAAGRTAFEACAPEHLANARQLVSGLSPHERSQLAALLGKLLQGLE